MSFGNFEIVDDVLEKYPTLTHHINSFLPSEANLTVQSWLLENIEFALQMKPGESELFLRESLIFPMLNEAWKRHRKLKLWSAKKLYYDEELFGEPDYFVSRMSSGRIKTPLLAVGEAKKEKFDEGWGQCLAEMIACQKINAAEGRPDIVIYGIVSTGLMWEFGKLEGQVFTQEPFPYSVKESNLVLGVLDYLFNACEKQLEN